jgi:hypothetical protein
LSVFLTDLFCHSSPLTCSISIYTVRATIGTRGFRVQRPPLRVNRQSCLRKRQQKTFSINCCETVVYR